MADWTNVVGSLGQVGEVIVLLGALYYASQQVRKSQDQNELDRKQNELDREQHELGREQLSLEQLIAWKNSALGLNNLALQYPDIFKTVLYPRSESAEEVRQLTAAYSSLHALEVMILYAQRRRAGG